MNMSEEFEFLDSPVACKPAEVFLLPEEEAPSCFS